MLCVLVMLSGQAHSRTEPVVGTPPALATHKAKSCVQPETTSGHSTKGTAKKHVEATSTKPARKDSVRHALTKSKPPAASRKGGPRHHAGIRSHSDGNAHHRTHRLGRGPARTGHTYASVRTSPDATVEASAAGATTPPSDLWLARDNQKLFDTLKDMRGKDGLLSSIAENLVLSAYGYLGAPYRYGGTSPDGFDCSGFVHRVYGDNGIAVGRSSRELVRQGMPVDVHELLPGDLVFFKMRSRSRSDVDHVGLYIGNGLFIHASSYTSGGVTLERLDSRVYQGRLVGARRILEHASDASRIIE
ncbi:MAG TPA: NlpC/P60 family protein [Deltaproteobacteria bacterium]|nr:NlpC/P60 family protein [Deltaproteobacteria bacterium]